ncbi:MAG TPA: prolyl-tRNA synthetase [Candidatus Magasanikbacteria bacterium]|nr:MAG: hypothetical protein A3I74_00815 [Candidatus Magasanikbacteria bacterium RIFCSPLOWO2_02_FULL_47_16]OGH80013.1 MAG: hypothetical protein A3C10_02410 [Candidatus Magasanikbacteria bacterium RIFCSPHIGHO2_02_FULL_48_18]OGH82923.1 MAG: hypothetical protein A3G08_04475 [Candidatus Magasanikbacteria bacterium RIFCSPLOWO2_12_FULL_47_9b]HAZ28510.1 prolyl-tRNA synthetase [Candidatus Magasanikbacteria bacterium]
MRQSILFTKTLKEAPKDEVSKNAQFLIRGGFVDKLFAGVYSILPLGVKVLSHIEHIVREELCRIDAQEVFLPALHPVENYQKTGRDGIDVLFFTEMHDGKRLVLGQSHEEVVTPLLQKYVQSYKDLPKSVFQFQTKFRNELRAKSGIMRGREFRMKDMYSFHETQSDADRYYALVEDAYRKIFDRLALGEATIKTYASGGTFSKYSHEFQTITSSGEDTIYLCESCRVAINKEIMADVNGQCPECGSRALEEKKAIEIANIFKLADRFTNAFSFTYTDQEGKKHPVIMGCYGLGITRTLGAIVEVHHDEKGIIWPESIAPYAAHLVSLCTERADVEAADELYHRLVAQGKDVLYDDRAGLRAGEKFADSDLIGIPKRVIVSPKTLANNTVEVRQRSGGEPEYVSLSAI